MKKFYLLLLLCFTLIYSQLVFSEDITGSIDNGRINWHWYASDSSLVITGTGELFDTPVPDGEKMFVDGDSIRLGYLLCFRDIASKIKKVNVGEGINYIGRSAFRYCGNLKEVEFPTTLKMLDGYVFYDTSYHLKKLRIPKNVKNFHSTLGVDYIAAHMQIDTLYWDVIDHESVGSFKYDSVWNVVFGDEVVRIPESFCSFNPCITEVNIPGNIKDIGDMCFVHCNNLSKLTLNEGVERFGYISFEDCPLLTEIKLPKSLKILYNEFENVPITEIDIPENVETIYHFKCSTLRRIRYNARNAKTDGIIRLLEDSVELYLGDSVQAINDYCFNHGKVKNVIDIPKSVRYIGESAFNSLKIGAMPPMLDYVGRYAFHAADFGDSLNLPCLGIIEQGAFSNCPYLKKLVINEVDSIKDGVFVSCPLLEYLEVTTTIPSYLGYLPFYNTPISEIIVPNCECIDAYEEKWASAKDTYLNPVSFVSKTPCDQVGVYDVETEQNGNKVRKEIRDGSIVISMPDGREYGIYGNQIR